MKNLINAFFLAAILLCISCDKGGTNEQITDMSDRELVNEWILVVHGGAGVILPENITDVQEMEITAALDSALKVGGAILNEGGTALDAITQSIIILENSPHFNAGKGSVLNHEGGFELDASIMEGANLEAGAIAGVKTVKNPILLARGVMEKSEHVMLSGEGADTFANELGLEQVDQSYFFTQRRYDALQKILEKEENTDHKYGTVGAVALDRKGNLAAGTSTGGMTNKKYNRIGDSPVIGAGTYADNEGCAVSSTGHGEYFIRHAVAHDLSARVKYSGADLQSAASKIIHEVLPKTGGKGGLIAIDSYGNYAMPFNTAGMFRGVVTPDSKSIGFYEGFLE